MIVARDTPHCITVFYDATPKPSWFFESDWIKLLGSGRPSFEGIRSPTRAWFPLPRARKVAVTQAAGPEVVLLLRHVKCADAPFFLSFSQKVRDGCQVIDLAVCVPRIARRNAAHCNRWPKECALTFAARHDE